MIAPSSQVTSESSKPPTRHSELLAWVDQMVELCTPERVEWCDGSAEEWQRLTQLLVDNKTFVRLNPERKPNSFWCASDPRDVARVEDRTFICSRDKADAGPTNNWMNPDEMKEILVQRFSGCMQGRTMYVIPFCMGPLNADNPKLGVEITDSAYVVVSMHIMTRMGIKALELFGEDAEFVPGLHSVGMPLKPGEPDVPWPCNDEKYIAHFPEDRSIASYGSGYGGNALLGKKCYSLRIASVIARHEGWLAEHMLIVKLTNPQGREYFVAAAFPSACGKTNLAMLEPTLPGWKAETIGDDIAWMRFGDDGRLYALNPECGFFGVAPGTGYDTNANAMRTIEKGNSIFTNVAYSRDGDIWWEGMTSTTPAHLTSWQGKEWTPESSELSSHPNSRFCTPARQCPTIAPEWENPNGVPISAILFGGRRQTTIPLVTESRDWQHGVFMGATLSSETTAAATGEVGVVRRDPMAMLPFMGYHAGDYFQHWLEIGKGADSVKLPRIFYVNWFRRGEDGRFLWPGYGENSRILKWITERIDGTASAIYTPIGRVPNIESLDLTGLDISYDDLSAALLVDEEEWLSEISEIRTWFDKIGDKLPTCLVDELTTLMRRLGAE